MEQSGSQALSGKRVAVIGIGAMGSALIEGLLRDGMTLPEAINAADPVPERGEKAAASYAVNFTEDNIEAVKEVDIVFLSVKPQVMLPVLRGLKKKVPSRALVVSIAAGITLEQIVTTLDHPTVIRAMPNTPGKVGQGMIAWVATEQVNEFQRVQAQALLGGLGKTMYFDDEKYIDMVTALSGSGPAYVLLFAEAMIDAGVRMGLPRDVAQQLVYQTIGGTVKYADETGTHPAQLRNEVTSPAGTTAEALNVFEAHGLRFAVSQAVEAAYKRSLELGVESQVGEDD